MRKNIQTIVNPGSPINRYSTGKRSAETPPSHLKRKTIVDQLISTVEKLSVEHISVRKVGKGNIMASCHGFLL
jgi:hypothetical protein